MDRVWRLHEYSRMLWCLTKKLSNNITKFASSTALHQSHSCRKCDHMFGKKVFWLFGLLTWIVDRDYMSIPRCYDIPKKLLSNYDCIIRYHMEGSIRTSVWFREHDLGQARLSTKFIIRLCFASKV